jgi:drug/metabolite transporter (DMT)-like permease
VPGEAPGGSPGLYAKLVLMAAMWGGLFSMGRILAPLLPPFTAGALRFAIASAVLIPLVLVHERHLPPLDRRQLGAILALGFAGVFVFNACFFAGLERISASRAALIIALNPVAVALAMRAIHRERLRGVQWLGIGLALFGVAVVLSRGDLAGLFAGAIGAGDVLVVGAVLGWTTYTLIARRVMGRLSGLALTAYSAVAGTIMLLAAALLEQPWVALAALPTRGWLAAMYAAVFATVIAFLFFNEGVRRIGPSRTSIFINLVPVFGVAIAASLLGEPISASLLAGGAMVICGVMLTSTPFTGGAARARRQ